MQLAVDAIDPGESMSLMMLLYLEDTFVSRSYFSQYLILVYCELNKCTNASQKIHFYLKIFFFISKDTFVSNEYICISVERERE